MRGCLAPTAARFPADPQPEGEGCYTWADGSTYEGAWHQGLKHGWGTYRWPNGACYRGEWRDGFMQVRRRGAGGGCGHREAGCRARREQAGGGWPLPHRPNTAPAAWRLPLFHLPHNPLTAQGYGTFESPDGARYVGNWAANLKHGIGKKVGGSAAAAGAGWTGCAPCTSCAPSNLWLLPW